MGRSASLTFGRTDARVVVVNAELHCREPSWLENFGSESKKPLNGVFVTFWGGDYWIGNIRARNNSMLAQPNMARLRAFNRFVWPSAWRLLHGSTISFPTASMSRANIRANCCRAWMPE